MATAKTAAATNRVAATKTVAVVTTTSGEGDGAV